jgi:hypothetical protein
MHDGREGVQHASCSLLRSQTSLLALFREADLSKFMAVSFESSLLGLRWFGHGTKLRLLEDTGHVVINFSIYMTYVDVVTFSTSTLQ